MLELGIDYSPDLWRLFAHDEQTSGKQDISIDLKRCRVASSGLVVNDSVLVFCQ